MVSAQITISMEKGLHVRPASAVSAIAEANPQCCVYINYKKKSITANSMIELLLANIKHGEEVEVSVNGLYEEEILTKIIDEIEYWNSR